MAQYAALIIGVQLILAMIFFRNVGIVTAADKLVEDVQTTANAIDILAGDGHTTHITAQEERTYITGVVHIVVWVATVLVVKHNAGLQGHHHTVHVF